MAPGGGGSGGGGGGEGEADGALGEGTGGDGKTWGAREESTKANQRERRGDPGLSKGGVGKGDISHSHSLARLATYRVAAVGRVAYVTARKK